MTDPKIKRPKSDENDENTLIPQTDEENQDP